MSQIQPRSPELCDRDTLERMRQRMSILSTHQSKTPHDERCSVQYHVIRGRALILDP